jgi:hypothetical protein
MADIISNIQSQINPLITGSILSLSQDDSRYSSQDKNLLQTSTLVENFGESNDYIEYHIYNESGNIISSNYSYLNYKLPSNSSLSPGVGNPPNTTGNIQTNNVGVISILTTTGSLYPSIEIDPVNDLISSGFSSGKYKAKYNLLQNKISNSTNRALFIKEISPNRTEIRLASVTLSNDEIEEKALELIDKINTSTYYVDYLLNFGNNAKYVAVNVALDKAQEGYEILFKLYQPLPLNIQLKDTLWVVEEKVLPYSFDLNLDLLILEPPPLKLKGPNFNLSINNQGTVSTTYGTYQSLVEDLQSIQNSSYQKILNLLSTQSIDINIDYTDFSKFSFFGSIYKRLTNFYNKVKTIEANNTFINYYTPQSNNTSSLQSNINQLIADNNTLISQFDGYESYLYFESSSYSWPKSGSLKPYALLPTTSPTVISWYNNLTSSALDYDNTNNNNLIYAVPEFLRNDENNQPFLLFLNMIGHYFDNIWIYLESVTDLYRANNNLEIGISRDLVYKQLISLGVHLYNSQAGEDVNQYLVGANTGSNIFDNNFSPTGSYLNNIPRKDLVSEIYKRIYHNLPLLLKTKGTVAGLEYLISTFGIPSQTYYTVGNNTFYTPTGSALTSSILNVKEYGGSLKSNLVNGYNNEKVRVISNTIYPGNTLSPYLSLQTYTTASSQFRDNDMNYVDISFSPQSQIDNYIAEAITSNNPTWSLDDFIGNPSQLYSSTYPDLDNQRKLYFETGVTGYSPFTASALDYNGFIRLIEYFDNSLFKMLNDFVPERTSLSTGVTINSPVLERNKVAYANPTNSTTQSVHTATYDPVNITVQYGKLYNQLQGDKKPFFTGELSGSTVDVHQYFVDNYNPYLTGDTSSYNAWHPLDQQINQNTFLHSDWNVLLNNIFPNVKSIYRNTLDLSGKSLVKVTRFGVSIYQDILYPSELQDSYLFLRSHNTSRYEGVKTTSQLYNKYTNGDKSYGKTAAIDRNVRQIGLFTQIESSSLLPKRNNVRLKYLVDEFGNLTELNQLNKNWWDVQRTFIMSDTASISLFDNKKFSNQKTTDGNKLVFDSGYTYSPVLYGTGNDARLYFDHTGDSPSYQGVANFLSSSYYIHGNTTLQYPISNNRVTNLFNNVIEEPENMTGGISTTNPVYIIPEGGAYNVNANVTVTMKNGAGNYGSASLTLKLYKNNSVFSGAGTTNNQIFEFIQPAASYQGYNGPYLTGVAGTQIVGSGVRSIKNMTLNYPAGTTTISADTVFYRFNIPMDTVWTSCLPGVGNVSIPAGQAYSLTQTLNLSDLSSACPSLYLPKRISAGGGLNGAIFYIPDFLVPLTGEQTITKTFSVSYSSRSGAGASLNAGDKVSASLEVDYISTGISSYYTASIDYPSDSKFTVTALANIIGNYPYNTIGTSYFANEDSSDVPPLGTNQLAFSTALTSFYSPEYIFLPTWESGSRGYSSSLYNIYGDVDYPFQLGVYDIFTHYDISGSYLETRILDAQIMTGSLGINKYVVLTFADDIPSGSRIQLENLSISPNKSATFLFLKRIVDETNVYLRFNKRPGLTSYGFLIPDNLAPDVLSNINTITSEIKTKLVNDQGSIITDVNGGGF